MKRTFRHRDARFRVVIQYARWGGQRRLIATVYLDGWGLFYHATRDTAHRAYRAADHAIRAYRACSDFTKYSAMRHAKR